MTADAIVNLTIGIGTILVAICAIINSFQNTRLAQAQVEMQIRERISNARTRYEDLTIKHGQNVDDELIAAVFNSAKEEFSNAYDEACQKYLDKKVDKIRFKKSYTNEIKNIVDNPAFSERYKGPQTQFQATVKVYQEWFTLE